ncbi:uncharacterized protein LOC125656743 [Ostrea edulis]|uniref:uncharacterized protein LOC125656743 n=1 Tax=Ostrea edulis TaxID=37623 RepID=UPI0024AFD129|nr:uncharacterized protein LOC125656743 [Ostrea edulis]
MASSETATAPYHCCVPCCTNDSRYDKERHLSFHKFPVDSRRRKQWIFKIRRDLGPKFRIADATRVCSEHFHPSEIRKTLTGKRMLSTTAVPSLFDWTKSTPTRRPPRKSLMRATCSEEPMDINDSGVHPSILQGESQPLVPMISKDHDYTVEPSSPNSKLEAAQKEIDVLQCQVEGLKAEKFGVQRFSLDAKLINFYTGFTNYKTFVSIFTALQPTATTMVRWTQMQRHSSNIDKIKTTPFKDDCMSLSLIDQFFMFMCRVRQGFPEQDLAVRFNISQASVSRILITWANYLYAMFGSLCIWPSRRIVDQNMPACFKCTYPNTRVILDCTEIKVQTPSSKVLNSETYSNYKNHTTFKSLIGITPFGSVSVVSSLYTGCISDKDISARSGIIDLIEENDQVMLDKGFLIQDLLDTKHATVVIPPFLGHKGKFSQEEVGKTHEITRLRIHVERAIR